MPGKPGQYRIKLKVGNRDLYGADFQWVDEAQDRPARASRRRRRDRADASGATLIGCVKAVRDGDRRDRVGPRRRGRRSRAACPRPQGARRDPTHRDGRHRGHQSRAGEAPTPTAAPRAQGVTVGPEVEAIEAEMAPLQERYRIQETPARRSPQAPDDQRLVAADGAKEKDFRSRRSLDVRFAQHHEPAAKVALLRRPCLGVRRPTIRASRTPRAASSRRSSAP